MTLPAWADDGGGGREAALAVLADHVLGEVVFATRPAGSWAVTTGLNVEILVPQPWNTPHLVAHAEHMSQDRSGGHARGTVSDASGTVIATASSWARFVELGGRSETDVPKPAAAAVSARAESWDSLLGVTVAEHDGVTTASVADSAPWANLFGTVHGGIWTFLTQIASTGIHEKLTVASIGMNFVRPANVPDAISVAARPVHIGRTSAVTTAIGRDGAGRTCTHSTVTSRAT